MVGEDDVATELDPRWICIFVGLLSWLTENFQSERTSRRFSFVVENFTALI